MSEMFSVRVCDVCGEIGSGMDTFCQRCTRRGTLRDCFRCRACHRLADTPTCPSCDAETGIQSSSGSSPVRAKQKAGLNDPIDIARPEPPAWLAGLIGGVIFGSIAGIAVGYFRGDDEWLTGLIGTVLGGAIGAAMNNKRS